MSSTQHLSVVVNHRGVAYPLLLLSDSTIASLQTLLEELTSVPPSHQKLLYSGKKASQEGSTLAEAGLKDGAKVQMLGPTPQELEGMKAVEDKQKKRNQILQERSLKPATKVRSTASPSSDALKYTFHRLEPLHTLPNPASALTLLKRLSDDPAIIHIMQKHHFEVGLLTELAPHEHPGLLGLNENAGQAIRLRLRTDSYDGFRLYAEIRRTLCHELTHNVWGNHNSDFKELNSRLNREVAEFERAVRDGTHYLGQRDVFEPSADLETEVHAHILGGDGGSSEMLSNEPREERRRKLLEATMNRLRIEEEEIEERCGTIIHTSSNSNTNAK